MSHDSFLVPFDISLDHSTLIQPKFPNWERSFVSGPESPLYDVKHRISLENPALLITQVHFKDKAEGPPGHVHGGATAGIIDEVMGVLVWHLGHACVTEKLSLQYNKALPLKNEAIILTEIKTSDHVNAKRIEVHSTIYDKKKSPYVSAQGLFHRLSPEQLQKFSRSKS